MTSKINKIKTSLLLPLVVIFGVVGCASTGDSAKSDADNEEARAAAEQEIIAKMANIPKTSPLSKIELGMSNTRVRSLIGDPNDSTSYQTGKAWIPFYYGTDVMRTDWIYDGEGRVVFSINRYSGQYKVINVTYDPDVKL